MANPVRKAPPPPPLRKGAVMAFQALYSYQSKKSEELSFEEGDLLYIVDQTDPHWWLARHEKKEGLIPSNYVSNDNMPLPIIDAARRGNVTLLKECLLNGVSPNSLDKTGSSPLHAASMAGHIACVELLLKEKKLEINLQNKIGDTPLHNAARKGHDEVVQFLLRNGAKKDIKNSDAQTAYDLTKSAAVIAVLDDADDVTLVNDRRSSHPNEDYLIDNEDSDEDT